MQLTAYGHACVALTGEGTRIVLDPGTFSDTATALAGATAVLVTHDHPDHVDVDAVTAGVAAAPGLEVWASGPARDALLAAGAPADRVHAVQPGQVLRIGDATVTTGGGQHAVIHPEVARAVNVTYLVELDGTSVYHPGDSFDAPAARPAGGLDVLLAPVSAPWLKTGEVIDFTRAVPSRVVVPVHDTLLTEIGHRLTARWLDTDRLGGEHDYVRLRTGESWHS